MMGKLFCLPAFSCRSKVNRAVTCANSKKGSEAQDITLPKKEPVGKSPLSLEDWAVQRDTVTNSTSCRDGILVKDVGTGEAASPVSESLPCKLQIGTDQVSFESTSPSSCLSLGHREIHTEEAPIQPKAAFSDGKGSQERLFRGNVQFTCRSCGSTDKSDSDPMGSDCTRHSGAESSSRPRKGFATSVAYAECSEIGIFGGKDLFGCPEEGSRAGILRYSPDKVISSIKCEKLGWDDAVLGEHASDPGSYPGEELQSLNGFCVLQGDGSAMNAFQPEGSPNPDLHSHKSGDAGFAMHAFQLEGTPNLHVSGDVAENLAVETCRHCSEPTYHIVDVMDPMPDNRSMNLSRYQEDISCDRNYQEQQKSYSSDLGEGKKDIFKMARNNQKLKDMANNNEDIGGIFAELGLQSLCTKAPCHESSLSRVKEWINTAQQSDMTLYEPSASEIIEVGHTSGGPSVIMDGELASAAVQRLPAYSTVADMAGFGLREVPSLGVFNCLKTLNLSSNSITRVLSGCLPQSVHTLDLSRNRISQIEGFRDLTRLRVLNLSYNRISRIGHGLSNCTLIKELYMVGNNMAEVDGLHRLLKLSILDLSHNKIATSKALGQLAANYSSLLALNLLGNPILMNVGEDQLRKLVGSLTPHVTYLNKQPIKAVSVREAAVDNVARAALGTSQRIYKSSSSKASRKVAGVQSSVSTQKHLPSHRNKELEKRPGSNSGRLSRQHHNHHRHHNRDSIGAQLINENGLSKEQGYLGTPLYDHFLHNAAVDIRSQHMHRSRSEGALQEE